MTKTESAYKKVAVVKRTVLGYDLNSKQNVYANYLVPSVVGCVLYVLHFSADLVVAYRHYREENPIWASLTVLFMYLPVIGCLVMATSSWELWPDIEGCGLNNVKWGVLKIFEHVFFPIWSMWRYAEKIFWSIDALCCTDEDARQEALECANAPRTIEFYFFLQAFLQAIPQILLQIHILMRQATLMDDQTLHIQSMSIILNLMKLSVTTTEYQRFKTQKIGGKDYPWYKSYKYKYCPSIDAVDGPSSRAFLPQAKKTTGIVYATRETITKLKRELESQNATPLPSSSMLQRRTSSDLYLLPSGLVEDDEEKLARETSVVDGPPRPLFRGGGGEDTIDFPRRLREIKGLPEDDVVGKIVAFMWWFCFLVARMLAICSFAYFYPRDIIWLLSLHFIVVVAFLLYDVQSYVVRKTKAVFFIFIGLVYIFCIIEFMKKFKKAKLIYYGFFTLVYVENFTMCLVWWCSNLDYELVANDWWFKYMFFLVIVCTLFSVCSMMFYIFINKPEKVVVDEEVI